MDRRDEEIERLRKENADLGWRLSLAHSMVDMLHKAYDILLSYGINYRSLRTYALWDKLMPKGQTGNVKEAREAILGWMQRVIHDMDAAVRRKLNIKVVSEQDKDEDNGI